MFELVYRSKAEDAVNGDDIKAILERSNRFNLEHQITGCLIFHKRRFVQILEGEVNIVKQLYADIEKDKRHFDLELLSSGMKGYRTFPSWSMAYCELKGASDQRFAMELFETNLKAFYEVSVQTSYDTNQLPTPTIRSFWLRVLELIK